MLQNKRTYYSTIILKFIVFILLFWVALQLLITGFKELNTSYVEQIIISTSHPFIALFIGLLATALLQSSSTITSMVVALVAAGTITIENATFMIMGANIGTTITSTLVSMGHFSKKKEFRKAIAAGTLHDFFNILTAIIILPLEYYFGFLSQLATYLASFFDTSNSIFIGGSSPSWSSIITKPILDFLLAIFFGQSIFIIILATLLLYFSIRFIAYQFKKILEDSKSNLLSKKVFRNPLQSLFSGIIVTSLIQSSSLITSLMVPLVATNKLPLKTAFPFLMGANIGTTLTALLAAMGGSVAGLSIAFTHLLFNLIGVLILFPFPVIRNIPVNLARRLGKASLKRKLVGLVYTGITFFLLPFILIYATTKSVKIQEYTYKHQVSTMIKPVNSKEKLYYRQTNLKNSWLERTAQNKSIKVKVKNGKLYLNREVFLLGKEGDCWTGRDIYGFYEACILEIKADYNRHTQITEGQCFVYEKKYQKTKNKLRIFISPKEELVIRYELLDKNNNVIGKEELIGIVK